MLVMKSRQISLVINLKTRSHRILWNDLERSSIITCSLPFRFNANAFAYLLAPPEQEPPLWYAHYGGVAEDEWSIVASGKEEKKRGVTLTADS